MDVTDTIAAMSAQLRRNREARTGIREPEPVKEPAVKAEPGKRRRRKPIVLDTVDPDKLIMLKTAARIAFPDGSMTESGLRNERRKGNLQAPMLSGRIYTTLNYIGQMKERLCNRTGAGDEGNQRISTSANRSGPGRKADMSSSTHHQPDGGSSEALDAVKGIAQVLKKPSRNTSPKSASPASAKVIRLRS